MEFSTCGTDAGNKKMKVLYDFEAVEDNELSFKTGDIITILDDSDPNWWKGEGTNGIGLFPSNFVTADVTEHSSAIESTEIKFSNTSKLLNGFSEPALAINEKLACMVHDIYASDFKAWVFICSDHFLPLTKELLNKTLHVLQSTDPETTTTDSTEVLQNEETCLAMGGLIDDKLKNLDKHHLELTLLNEKILESLRLYDKLMNQTPIYPPHTTAQSSTYTVHSSSQQNGTVGATPYQPSSAAVYTPAVNPNYVYSHPFHHSSQPPQPSVFSAHNHCQ